MIPSDVGTPGPWSANEGSVKRQVTRTALALVLERINAGARPVRARHLAEILRPHFGDGAPLVGSSAVVGISTTLLKEWGLATFERRWGWNTTRRGRQACQ